MAYKTPKHIEEQKQIKKKHILNIAAKVFSNQGYHGTTIKDIVDEAGISVGSFYFYFKSKEEIFESLLDEMANHFIIECEEATKNVTTFEKQAELGITNFIRLIMDHRNLAKIMMIEAGGISPVFRQKNMEKWDFFAHYIKEKLDLIVQEGIIPPIDTMIAAYAYTGAIQNIIIHWLSFGEPENLLDAVPSLLKFNLRGIGIIKE